MKMNKHLEIMTTWVSELGVNCELQNAIANGLSGVRLILKGSRPDTRTSIEAFCVETRRVNPEFKIMVDLPGSKPRLGYFGSPRSFVHDQSILLSYDTENISSDTIPTECLSLYRSSIKVGDRLLINDGETTFKVTETHDDYLKVTLVDENATIMSSRSINLPDSSVRFNALTLFDIESLHMLRGLDIDMVAVSMINNSSDIQKTQETLKALNIHSEIIAKIETPEALINLDEIISVADSLMIARGDLSTICGGTNLFSAQENIIETSNRIGTSIISATGLLTSLAKNSEPSISELCDISHLIQKGVHRFLLADAELCLAHPSRACKWIYNLYDKYKLSNVKNEEIAYVLRND